MRSGSCRQSASASQSGRRSTRSGEAAREDANVDVGRQDSTAKCGKRAHGRTLFTPRRGRRTPALALGGGGWGEDEEISVSATTTMLQHGASQTTPSSYSIFPRILIKSSIKCNINGTEIPNRDRSSTKGYRDVPAPG